MPLQIDRQQQVLIDKDTGSAIPERAAIVAEIGFPAVSNGTSNLAMLRFYRELKRKPYAALAL